MNRIFLSVISSASLPALKIVPESVARPECAARPDPFLLKCRRFPKNRARAFCGGIWMKSLNLLQPFGLLALRLALGVIFLDRKSTRLNSSHVEISYAVFCLKKKIPAPTGEHHDDRKAHCPQSAAGSRPRH